MLSQKESSKSMKCPVLKIDVGSKCHFDVCPFHSSRLDSGCFYGESVTVANYAFHKRQSKTFVQETVKSIDAKIKHAVMLFKYSMFCSEDDPSEQDIIDFERLMITVPYTIPVIAKRMTASRLACMKREYVFKQFQKISGYSFQSTIRDFLYEQTLVIEEKENGRRSSCNT